MLDWEVRNAPPLRWRVLRSTEGYADSAEPPGVNKQTLIMDGTETRCTDEGLAPSEGYFYTIFAENEHGIWQRQVESHLRHRDAHHWLHPDAAQYLENERDLEVNPVLIPKSIPWSRGATTVQVSYHGREAGTELGEYLRSEGAGL